MRLRVTRLQESGLLRIAALCNPLLHHGEGPTA
jgi:hypothetical protein